MKTVVAAAVATTLLLLGPAAHANGTHDHTPKHGGVVTETKTMDLELVARADQIQLYARDHGKPLVIKSGSAKLTMLSGTEKTEVQLPLVGDRLEAKGSFKVGKGTKVVAVVTVNGKPPVTARFELK
jgi:hypothetical protein